MATSPSGKRNKKHGRKQKTANDKLELVQGNDFKPNKKDGQRRIKSYEIFFPGQFTNDHPWGEKDEPISIQDSICIRKEKCPNEASLPEVSIFQDHAQASCSFSFNMNVPVMHVTHYDKAAEIISENAEFDTFKPQPRDHRNRYNYKPADLGPICNNSSYKPFTGNADTFPLTGYFSWWTLDPLLADSCPPLASVPDAKAKYTINPTPTFLFQNEQQSIYGNVKFSAALQVVVDAYEKSLGVENSGRKFEILFKKAGTFRYKYVIAYVILVCARMEGDEDPFSQYETLHPGEDCCLRISKPYREIIYNGNSWQHKYSTSHDHYVLAFHFPRHEASLQIEKSKGSICNVTHNKSRLCQRLTWEEGKQVNANDQCLGDDSVRQEVNDEIKRRHTSATSSIITYGTAVEEVNDDFSTRTPTSISYRYDCSALEDSQI